MIVEFSVRNFRSIKDLQTISFAATGLKSPEDSSYVDTNNIVPIGEMRLLKTLGIYGANGSGKSNVIRAFDYFIDAVRNEASTESRLGALCDPFLYQDDPYAQESFFQIVMILDNKKYRYGFTVRRNDRPGSVNDSINDVAFSKDIVVEEWLFGQKEKNMVELFTRTNGQVNKDKLGNKEPIPDLTTQHHLFLTYASAFDKDGICAKVRKHITARRISNFKNGFEFFRWNTIHLIEQEGKKQEVLQFLAEFNLRYDDIELDRDPSKPNEILSHDKIMLVRSFMSSGKEHKIRLNLSFNESSGTQKLFDLAGVFLRAFKIQGSGLILLDEIDSHFHPSLLLRLVNLLNNPTINKSNTQLIFTSHDTNLLSPSTMRRDQFYFTEKGNDESSRLYSLADLKGIRNDADFAKQYLAGYYGAVPILEDFVEYSDNNTTTDGSLEY